MSDIVGEIIKTAASIGVSCIPTFIVVQLSRQKSKVFIMN